ncbi:MAG TPA: M23 family metallopeptidase [Clostridia bacterium]|nr:M23 family metallopeptidase [Clostridia bacterium]
MQRKTPGKLPLDLPVPRVRYRNPAYRGKADMGEYDTDKTAPLFRKIFICAVIIVLVLVLKYMDTDFSKNVVGYIRDGITNHIDIDEALGKLKFVNNYLPDNIAVFGEQPVTAGGDAGMPDGLAPFFAIPAEGKVIERFSSNNRGINISGSKNDNVYAVAEGLVLDIGEDEEGGKYVKLDHGNNVTTLYKGCSLIDLSTGERTTKGQSIGKMGGTALEGYTLYFEAQVDNRPVDPLALIELGK